jgi:hypothetical protein
MTIFPTPKVLSLDFVISGPADSPDAFSMISHVLGRFPAFDRAGISGYPLIIRNTTGLRPGSRVTGIMGKLIMLNETDPEPLMTHLNPVLAHINETWPGEFSYRGQTSVFGSFAQWYDENYDHSPAGYNSVMASRLLDADALEREDDAGALRDALDTFAQGDVNTVFLVAGRGTWKAKPRGGGNAVSPAWRKAVVHATVAVAFDWLDADARAGAIASTNSYVEGLKKISPHSGAYLNEAGPEQPNYRHEFWGDNYDRLLKIKRTVDPGDVLWCTPCVGNERWEEVDGRLCSVEDS